MEIDFDAFTGGSSKGQGAYILYTNSTPSTKRSRSLHLIYKFRTLHKKIAPPLVELNNLNLLQSISRYWMFLSH